MIVGESGCGIERFLVSVDGLSRHVGIVRQLILLLVEMAQ